MTDKNANTEIRKEFCPNCEAETPCTHEAELFVCDICGEDFAKYIVPRSANVSDVSTTQDVLMDIKTPKSIENTNPDYYKQEIARRDEIITRLKEDAERLLEFVQHIPNGGGTCWVNEKWGSRCVCGLSDAITLHRTLMKEIGG